MGIEKLTSCFAKDLVSLCWLKSRSKLSVCLLSVLCGTMAIASQAQTFTTLVTFDGANGAGPLDAPVQGADGKFYGTTFQGGANNWGTVFKISALGHLTTIYSFCAKTKCADGAAPMAPLVLGTDGNFYGTTAAGGAHNRGVIFKITSEGRMTKLYAFCSHERFDCGYGPGESALIQGTDGDFYGASPAGPSGFIYKVTPQGSFSLLYSFCSKSNCTDGREPVGGLVQGINGEFYGTTNLGGAHNNGTVFEITSTGQLTTLYSFCAQTNCADGALPAAGLVQASNGHFYGTTSAGGPANAGTIFKMTPVGQLTTLYSFCIQTGCPDGSDPNDLVQGPAGNFYGTAGTAFKITASGHFTALYTFDSWPNGITLGTDGKFYGTTYEGGTNKDGIVFSLAIGLSPLVETVQTSGKAGAAVTILGTDLTGATGVTFNGTEATFIVKSSSEITTTVPTGATTGNIKVTTPERTLSSIVLFRVTN
jgi:uncharacterized repeat protein (TIGR03803 family)